MGRIENVLRLPLVPLADVHERRCARVSSRRERFSDRTQLRSLETDVDRLANDPSAASAPEADVSSTTCSTRSSAGKCAPHAAARTASGAPSPG